MRDTPRTFVGTVVLQLDRPIGARLACAVQAGVGSLPGVSSCEVEVAADTVVVTAATPVDRSDVVKVLDGLGCKVRA